MTAPSPTTIPARACASSASRSSRAACWVRSQGLRLHEMKTPEVCCGFGGTFCVKYPEISNAMVGEKIGRYRAVRRRHAAGRRPRLPDEHGGQAAAPGQRGAGAARRRGAGRHGAASPPSASRKRSADAVDGARLQATMSTAPSPIPICRIRSAKLKVGFSERRRQAAERLPEFEALRDSARDIKNHTLGQSRFLPRGVRAQGHRAGRPRPLGADGRRCAAHHRRPLPQRRRQDRRQVQVDGLRGDRAQRSSRGARHRADRDRSRRIHHPAAPRAAQPHHRAGGASHQGPGGRHVPRASPGARLHQAPDRAQRPGGRGAPRAAREIPGRRCRPDRRQLPGRRDRLVDAGHQRGQRRSLQHAAQDAHRAGQHREGDPDARGCRRAAARAGALGDGPGIVGLHDAEHRAEAAGRPRRAAALSRGASSTMAARRCWAPRCRTCCAASAAAPA